MLSEMMKDLWLFLMKSRNIADRFSLLRKNDIYNDAIKRNTTAPH